jgi:molecular chaperone GrpE
MTQPEAPVPNAAQNPAPAEPHEVQGLPSPQVAALEKELEEVRQQATDNLDKFVRAKAEMENIRRRAETDVSAAHKYAVERFAGEIVNVRDSLDLAKSVDLTQGSAEVLAKMKEGLELTLKQLDGVFGKFGITLLDPKGEKFDPNRHQAISMVDSAEVPAGHVLTVVQKGYLLQDRVLRPAMVVVAKVPAASNPS